MTINTAAIRKAASGDQSKKVAVSKAWLHTVANEIDRLRVMQPKDARRDMMDDFLNLTHSKRKNQ